MHGLYCFSCQRLWPLLHRGILLYAFYYWHNNAEWTQKTACIEHCVVLDRMALSIPENYCYGLYGQHRTPKLFPEAWWRSCCVVEILRSVRIVVLCTRFPEQTEYWFIRSPWLYPLTFTISSLSSGTSPCRALSWTVIQFMPDSLILLESRIPHPRRDCFHALHSREDYFLLWAVMNWQLPCSELRYFSPFS